MGYFEDVEIGQETIFPRSYELTKDEIVSGGKKWAPQTFHIDEGAAKESIFGGLVAASVHLFSISVKLTHSAYRFAQL